MRRPDNMKQMKDKIRKYMKWILPVIFIGYFGIVSLFEHAHIVDGVIVVHSHPFETLPGGAAHHHPAGQLQFFSFLSHFIAGDGCVASLTVGFLPSLLFSYAVLLFTSAFISLTKGALQLRAPPIA